MTEVQIRDDKCWICESKKELTVHHVLPKHLKPRHNMTVPICRRCHNNINKEDLRGLAAYAVKIDRTLEEMQKGVKHIYESVFKYIEDKRKKWNQ